MNPTIKTLIIDDEPYSRDELKHLLNVYSEIEIIGEADTGGAALEKIITLSPDLIFVDIDMPQMSGLELAAAIQKVKKVPLVVFATAYPDYAVKAFRVQALDYVLKPFDEEQFTDTIIRIKKAFYIEEKLPKKEKPPVAKLSVEDEDRIVYLPPREIVYLFREERETVVCTKSSQYTSKATLKELEHKLEGYSFFRTHKSYLVNLNAVTELIPWFNGAYQLKVTGRKEEIPISRNYVKELRERLEL